MLKFDVHDGGCEMDAEGTAVLLLEEFALCANNLYAALYNDFKNKATKAALKEAFQHIFAADSPVWELEDGEAAPPVQGVYLGKQT